MLPIHLLDTTKIKYETSVNNLCTCNINLTNLKECDSRYKLLTNSWQTDIWTDRQMTHKSLWYTQKKLCDIFFIHHYMVNYILLHNEIKYTRMYQGVFPLASHNLLQTFVSHAYVQILHQVNSFNCMVLNAHTPLLQPLVKVIWLQCNLY